MLAQHCLPDTPQLQWIMTIPDLGQLFRAFFRIGCLSFGGPAGQIALMHRELVDERGWVEEGQYLRALNFCHLLPGPEAQQLATWIGWRLHGVVGGLIAGLLFVLPGALVIFGLSLLYVHAAGLSWFDGLFLGVKAAVLAIVAQALLRIAGRALKTGRHRLLALAAFVALALFNLPFPLVLIAAALIGAWLLAGHAAVQDNAPLAASKRQLALQTLRTMLLWAAIWAAPMVLVWLTLGGDHRLADIGTFFSQLAVVTFGGAYAVLAYMAQEAVNGFGWLNAGEMADGLGLAETTPGPLVMVTQFVGFLAAWRAPEPFSPLLAGIIGSALTTWVTFAPSFLLIFALAPWMERLERIQWLQSALSGITAAVVGIIANLALWFVLHLLFAEVARWRLGPVSTSLPDVATLNPAALLLTLLALILAFRWKMGTLPLLAVSALAGLALSMLPG
jgi:chromate transporter